MSRRKSRQSHLVLSCGGTRLGIEVAIRRGISIALPVQSFNYSLDRSLSSPLIVAPSLDFLRLVCSNSLQSPKRQFPFFSLSVRLVVHLLVDRNMCKYECK